MVVGGLLVAAEPLLDDAEVAQSASLPAWIADLSEQGQGLLDMGRSATNVVGNAVASTLVARWENELGPEIT